MDELSNKGAGRGAPGAEDRAGLASGYARLEFLSGWLMGAGVSRECAVPVGWCQWQVIRCGYCRVSCKRASDVPAREQSGVPPANALETDVRIGLWKFVCQKPLSTETRPRIPTMKCQAREPALVERCLAAHSEGWPNGCAQRHSKRQPDAEGKM